MNDCTHGLESDPVTGGHVTESGTGWFKVETCQPPTGQIAKCEHGVYIALGDETARHCGFCNPDLYTDPILLRTMSRRKPINRVYPEDKTLDTSDFMNQSSAARMAGTKEFFEL